MRLIIGLTGAFGSGCSFIGKNFFEKTYNYKYVSLSQILREEFENEYKIQPKRHELQEYGNKKRESDNRYLAKKVSDLIEDKEFSNKDIIIDSIRNPAEIAYFRERFPKFLLIAVFADYDIRWNRVKKEYNNSKDSFDKDEIKDQGSFEPSYGQKISDCFFESDLVISNNENINFSNPNKKYNEMDGKLKNYIKAFSDPTSSNPTVDETLMSMAYAIGRRSKCIKRRVGAVIVDNKKCVLSTGFNSVPAGLPDCKDLFGSCYRDKQKLEIKNDLSGEIKKFLKDNNLKAEEAVSDNFAQDLSKSIIKRIKILELCRSLHAEENAILSLVGRSTNSDLTGATLYATTYPCNLCANKIVQIGIKKIVYFEPYPVLQAKEIFESGSVKAEPFEGVTFRAFFKAFNYKA